MTIDPQVLRAESHGEVGQVIERDAGLILERWTQRAVQEQPNAARAHHHVLRDDLQRLLRKLGEALAEPLGPDECPHSAVAAEHGVQRWGNGWSLTEVARDYQILRIVLLDYLEEAIERPLLYREVQAIGLAVDEAMSVSIAAYVRQREEALEAQAKVLRESDRRKNEFLATLAHELRNPLAPILNSVEVLRLLGPADANVALARDIVERQVKQLVRLVDDLLDATRIAQGKIQLKRTTFDLAVAVAQAEQMARPLFEAQHHQLSVTLAHEPLRLEADQARVVQVIVNLLNNAGKYTDSGGRISLTGTREGNEVVIRVRDNGVGIEPAMLGRVFDMFTQVDRSLNRSQGGLGIGLTLVRQLVELHGGRVSAHSDGPGKGSEFVVRLPAAPPAAAESAAGACTPVPAPTGRHILIIEDNQDARSTLETLLRLLGHRVEGVGTGPEGIERALATQPQIALIDLGLPGLDGYAVARKLRGELGEGVLLVALTGHAQDEDRRRTREAGFNAHLVKPVELDDLNRLLAEVK